MSTEHQRWAAVDDFLTRVLIRPDRALTAALEDSDAAGLRAINVTPAQGKFLHLLARIQGARRILELGTLAGYSTIWLARALPPGGRLITIEVDPAAAAIARANLARAGLLDVVDLEVGPALDVLPRLHARGAGPVDLIFIDADKPNTPAYLAWAVRLSRPGTLVIVDNVIRKGAIVDGAVTDPKVEGMRRTIEILADGGAIDATVVQTVCEKGYDGFAIGLVTTTPAIATATESE